jgi:hypothetical protein
VKILNSLLTIKCSTIASFFTAVEDTNLEVEKEENFERRGVRQSYPMIIPNHGRLGKIERTLLDIEMTLHGKEKVPKTLGLTERLDLQAFGVRSLC